MIYNLSIKQIISKTFVTDIPSVIIQVDTIHEMNSDVLQDWCRWPDESFEEMDSTLAVQQVIRDDRHLDTKTFLYKYQRF